MKIKHHKIVIPEGNPFENCKLNRKQYAEVLTSIVSTYADGFVLAINNEWGTGKTTFVEMWQQQLKNNSFQTIYFNAWENDFDNNPLVAIMAELKSLTKSDNKAFNSVLKKGAILTKSVAPELLKALLNKYTGLDKTSLETIKNSAEGITEILKDEIEDYTNKKKTIVEFREELAKFIKEKSKDKPLIFIIDELDRCRPDYAVEVLEQMKHFFTVPGIVFVLSIDKNHLASSVRGFYGSKHINTDEYLRRFIDLEYSIPQPKTEDFVDYLYDYYSFDDFFYSKERQKYRDIQRDSEAFLLMTKNLLKKSNSTLRQQEKIFAYTRLVLCSFKENEYVFPALLFVLMYLKSMKLDTYKKIEAKQLSLQELSNVFTGLFNGVKDNDINFSYIEAQLLSFYNNDREYPYKENTFSNLADYFKVISRQTYNRFKLDFLLHKINLTQPIFTQDSDL
jgi:hypothetical protein